MAARELAALSVDLNGSGATPALCFTQNKVLAADVAETITLPSFTTAASATKYADFVEISATANAYVSYFPATYEADVIQNGAFASDTLWTKGTGWTIAAGVATATGAISTALTQVPVAATAPLIEGQAYLCTFTVTAFSAGTVTLNIGGTAGTARGSAATFAQVIIAGSGSTVGFTTSGFTGSIDNFSMVPVAFVPTADIETGGYGMDLVVSAAGPIIRSLNGVKSISVISAATCILSLRYFRA